MPELPEVETMVRDLRARVVGACLTSADVFWPRTLGHPDVEMFNQSIRGQTIAKVTRRGKFALLALDSGMLAIHRGMTGSVFVRDEYAQPDRFVRAVLYLEDGRELRFDDARKFGRIYLHCIDDHKWVPPWERLGPEPLGRSFSAVHLQARLNGRRIAIKSALLNQSIIAGLGNIYADEALFAAAIDPRRSAGSLSELEADRLRSAIRAVLSTAIRRRGTTFSSYRDVDGHEGRNKPSLMVFQRNPGPCPRCGGEIARIILGARSTHFCVRCQT